MGISLVIVELGFYTSLKGDKIMACHRAKLIFDKMHNVKEGFS